MDKNYHFKLSNDGEIYSIDNIERPRMQHFLHYYIYMKILGYAKNTVEKIENNKQQQSFSHYIRIYKIIKEQIFG